MLNYMSKKIIVDKMINKQKSKECFKLSRCHESKMYVTDNDVITEKKNTAETSVPNIQDASTQTSCEDFLSDMVCYENTIKSVTKNIRTWIFFVFAIAIVAKDNFFKGCVTFFVMLFLVYWVHQESHSTRNWLTISHHYHHEHNNWFSHGIQILIEMQFGLLLPIVNNVFMDNILDNWVIILLYIFYTTVHNINYSIFHVNQTHELHHENINTNMGPDICDILFNTKNNTNLHDDGYLEDTGHYITNIIIGTISVMLLKKLCKCPITKLVLDWWSYIILIVISTIIVIANTYLINNDM